MSNRRKAHRAPLDPGATERVRASSCCPDCDSIVHVGRTSHRVRVEHDPSCPALRALTRQGRTRQIVLARRDNQTEQQFADEAGKVAAIVAEHRRDIWPNSSGLRIAGTPYQDLSLGDGQDLSSDQDVSPT